MDNAIINPFLTSGYLSAEYFCDREEETKKLTRLLTNGNNVALISRRMGKTGLIRHCFAQPKIVRSYNTFLIYQCPEKIFKTSRPQNLRGLDFDFAVESPLPRNLDATMGKVDAAACVPSPLLDVQKSQTCQCRASGLFASLSQVRKSSSAVQGCAAQGSGEGSR